MRVFVTDCVLDDVRTYLANIEEPNNEEEWDAFDAEKFFEVALPPDFSNKSPFIDNDGCETLLSYMGRTFDKNITVGEVYEFLTNLNEEIDDHLDYLRRKEKTTSLDKDEMYELLWGGMFLEV